MPAFVLHLVWQPHPAAAQAAAEAWQAVLLRCAALSPRVEPAEGHQVFLDLAGIPDAPSSALRFLKSLNAVLPPRRAERRPRWIASLAPNKFLARLASSVVGQTHPAVPQGFAVRQLAGGLYAELDAAAAERVLAPLPLRYLWPLPPQVIERLTALGIASFGELRLVPRHRLVNAFGFELGTRLLALARGLDATPVQPLYPPRTVEVYWASAEEQPASGWDGLSRTVSHLAHRLAAELRARGEACASLALRLEGAGAAAGHALKLRLPTCDADTLAHHALRLLARASLPSEPSRITLIAGDLGPPRSVQAGLFPERRPETERRIEQIVTEVQKRFGTRAIQRAGALRPARRERMRAVLGT